MNHVQEILSDDEKTIYSVRVTVERQERVDSGSMMFSHKRYITFGQMVVFTDKDVADDQCGALFFKRGNEQEILMNIYDYIHSEKECPKDSVVIGEIQ